MNDKKRNTKLAQPLLNHDYEKCDLGFRYARVCLRPRVHGSKELHGGIKAREVMRIHRRGNSNGLTAISQ